MRTVLLACTMALASILACVGARADGVGGPDRDAIRMVISQQIEAFRRDDGTAALRFAAPALQARFGTGAQFLHVVRAAFMPVYRAQTVSFTGADAEDGIVIQRVELVGPDGAPALALYSMERQDDGSWRIAGCQLVKSERQAT